MIKVTTVEEGRMNIEEMRERIEQVRNWIRFASDESGSVTAQRNRFNISRNPLAQLSCQLSTDLEEALNELEPVEQ